MSTACAALRICPACAYEASSAAVSCGHCGKALPAKETVRAVMPEERSGRGRGAVVSSAVVIAEGRLARKYLKAGQADLALFFARNTLALEALTARDGASNLAKRAAKLVEEAKSAARTLNRPCRSCDGSGKVIKKTGGHMCSVDVGFTLALYSDPINFFITQVWRRPLHAGWRRCFRHVAMKCGSCQRPVGQRRDS